MPEAQEPSLQGLNALAGEWDTEGLRMHCFDSRGVARIYQTSFVGGVWKLWRDTADFSPLDFAQRFAGTFSSDGKTIDGRWESRHDGGTWEEDLQITYRELQS